MTEAERKFMAENGMSSHKALEYVFQWQSEGKMEQAKKGCEEILKFFPENAEVTAILKKINAELDAKNIPDEEPQETPQSLQERKGILNKAEGILNVISPKKPSPQNTLPGIEKPQDKDRILAALSYFWIISLIAIFLKRDSEFVQHHAWQGLVIFLLLTVAKMFFFTPFLGINGFLTLGMQLVAVSLMVFPALGAYTGQWLKIPVIYKLSQNLRSLF